MVPSARPAHYAVLIAGVRWLEAQALVAAQAGALVGALVNYALNARFNYQSADRAHLRAGAKFLTVAAAGFLLNGLVVGMLTSGARWHYLAAQVMATLLVFLLGFVANHFWTFAPRAS